MSSKNYFYSSNICVVSKFIKVYIANTFYTNHITQKITLKVTGNLWTS